MRKLFLLLPALVFTLITNAKEIEISSATSNIIHSTIANAAEDGDVLVLTDAGPYISTAGDDYTKLVKNLTIKAADGIEPVVKLEVPFRSTGGKTVKFIGITFDGTSLTNYDFYFRFYDDADNNLEFEDCEFKNISKYIFDVYTGKKANSLKLTNCDLHDNSSRGILNRGTLTSLEINGGQIYNFTGYPVLDNYNGATLGDVNINGTEFYNNAKDIISGTATSHANSCTINNCYFHNNAGSAVYFAASTVEGVETCDAVIVRNSTFANNDLSASSRSVIDVQNYGAAEASNIEVTVDHCTFYNNTTVNYDYSCVRSRKSTKVSITNSIFAYPSAIDFYATNCYGGTISNTLVYNLNRGHRSSGGAPAITNIITADPLFADAANGDFSFAGNWVTMNISPARGAATDGSDLGDPRWYSAEVLPETDFASPHVLTGDKAKLTGHVATDASNYLLFSNSSDATQHGVAIWKVHATRSCILQATLNIDADNGSGHRYQIEVFDSSNTLVGSAIGESANSWDKGDKVISDLIMLSEAGDYKIKLSNLCDNSANLLHSITLSYAGGEVQNMPGTTNIADAWFSANGTRADGKITYTSISSGCWAKWNINVASAGTYNVIVNIQNVYGHNYAVEFLKEGEITPISIDEGGTTYGNDATLYPVEVGAVTLEPGNYEMKVSNAIGDAALLNVTLAYAGGAAVELSKTTPASLLANADAILSNDWTIEAGQISYSESKATTGWAKWNVNCADYGNYTMTVNISSDNGHGMRVEVFEDEAQPAIYTLDEPSSGKYHTGDLALNLGSIVLADRDYVVKITNTVSSSHAKITSIVITYLNGAQATLPATFNFEDGMLSEKAHITAGELWFNTIGDSNPVGQWAKWNVKVAEAGTFLFTMNTNSTNDQKYKVTILDENDNEIDAFESKGYSSGAVEIKHYFNLAAGNYTVKLENTKSWSQGHIVSLMVTQPSLLVLNEAAETNTVIHDNYRNGAHDIQIIRTIVAGMYNTICLPFDVNSTQLQAIFGSDVELRQMSSAELNGNELDLNFEAATSIYRGTPYLIKTSKTVTNPVFADVEIKAEVGDATSGTAADFIGTLIKGEVPAGEDNLFLGQNDMLYFSSTATPINGMRAWFKVKVPNPQHVIQHARIVTGGQVVTSIDLVNGDIVNETVKAIENGQLVIIRDGVRYNAIGIRLQ